MNTKHKSILVLSILLLVMTASAATIVSKVEIWSEYPMVSFLGIGDRLYLVTESDGQKYYQYSSSIFLNLAMISYIQPTKNMPLGGFPDGFEGMDITMTPVSCTITSGQAVRHTVVAEYNGKRIGDYSDYLDCGTSGQIRDSLVLKNELISAAGIDLQTNAEYTITVKENLYWQSIDPVRGSTTSFKLVVGSGATPTPTITTPTPTQTTPTPTQTIPTPTQTTPTPTQTTPTPTITTPIPTSTTPLPTQTTPNQPSNCLSGYMWDSSYETCRPVLDVISSSGGYLILGILIVSVVLLKKKGLKW